MEGSRTITTLPLWNSVADCQRPSDNAASLICLPHRILFWPLHMVFPLLGGWGKAERETEAEIDGQDCH